MKWPFMLAGLLLVGLVLAPAVALADPCEGRLPARAGEPFAGVVRYVGDPAGKWAFQVTADKTTAKVKATLEKMDALQRLKYPNVRILVIGEKQGSYEFTGEPFASAGFTADMVWDFNDVCGRLMSLPIDTLVDLQSYVSKETRRVRIELEIPDEDGRFPTGIDNLVEALPTPRLSDAAKFVAYYEAKDTPIEREEAEAVIAELSKRLAVLPRLTREVFKFLVERRDASKAGFHDDFRMSDPKLRRIYRGDDLDGDLALLSEARLIDLNDPDNHGEAYYWSIRFPGRTHGYHDLIVDYLTDLGIDLRKPFITLDFSDF